MKTLTQWKFDKNKGLIRVFELTYACIDSIVDGAKEKLIKAFLVWQKVLKPILYHTGKKTRDTLDRRICLKILPFHNEKKKTIIWTASTHGVRKW